ncbi:MAG: DUF2877 domain-containing protein [Chloroflexota bacterium]|nr:DUF2877 domain-containing protein [Chloroflexota bacterium]
MSQPSDSPSSPLKVPAYAVKCMGLCIPPIFARAGAATVLGDTSKGVFLQHKSGQVCFVSGEVFCGPITINLHRMLDFKGLFTLGEKCQILGDRLDCSGCQILIESDTPIWEPPPIRFKKRELSQAVLRGINLERHLIRQYEDGFFFPFLDKLAGHSSAMDRENFRDWIPGLKGEGDLFHQLPGLIGFGRGLTPAGDDFICGFLLAQYYLGKIFPSPQNQENFSDHIAALAQAETTALSATLIRCAAQGAGDERVLNALRWIAQGDMDMNKVREELLSYGSSSGLDALAGMLAAILHQQGIQPS